MTCVKLYSPYKTLKAHSKLHSGEKPYKCEVCLATLIQLGDLPQHLKVHSGEKPYNCEVCSASLSISNTFKEHLRSHTGEKPYRCEICSALPKKKAYSEGINVTLVLKCVCLLRKQLLFLHHSLPQYRFR